VTWWISTPNAEAKLLAEYQEPALNLILLSFRWMAVAERMNPAAFNLSRMRSSDIQAQRSRIRSSASLHGSSFTWERPSVRAHFTSAHLGQPARWLSASSPGTVLLLSRAR